MKKLLFGILAMWVLLIFFLLQPQKHDIVKYYEQYTVQANDTLWSIASQYPHDNIQELIYIIKDNNNTDANLKIGQVLIIPILEVK